jgi:UDP-N-acetylmuramoyl-L-alanyl-D-glutamate--2,6-diaminopimelate ligase
MHHEPQPMALRLDDLMGALSGFRPTLIGDGKTIVCGITEDSRKVAEGTLFVARAGQASDGVRFISEARSRGASAVLCERGAATSIEPRIEVLGLRAAWGVCAHEFYGRPSESLSVIGITGTNGKTTVACLVEQALLALGVTAGRLGTLGFFFGGKKLEDSLTTPQPDQLARSLAHVRDGEGRAMVLEVSSHALDQDRAAGVRFASVALTNLTQDHLDYHHSMEEYARAKGRLFREGAPGARVFNIDDPWGAELASEFPGSTTVSAAGSAASVRVVDSTFGTTGVTALVHSEEETRAFSSPLLGQHNLENLLVAWGILLSLGHASDRIAQALAACRGVPGRLERCDTEDDDIAVVVDYAHTPDALQRVLETLRPLGFEELICVFGCGGDRDRTKRAPMGRVAAQLADRVVLTSDNPRTEDPQAILDEVKLGLAQAKSPPIIEIDRRKAIECAVQGARSGAVVLIAGKGHEDYQLVAGKVLPFDDREEARRALTFRRAAGVSQQGGSH